ncbi:MAG: T9SS type A sorting domain-containing protein [Calditrichaceae bacterium]
MEEGDSAEVNLTISNSGKGNLNWSMWPSFGTEQVMTAEIKNNIENNDKLPATSSEIVERKIESVSIIKHFDAAASNVLIFRDNLAWGFDVNVPLLESLGPNVSVAPSEMMDSLNLTLYDLIILESDQTSDFYLKYVQNINKFKAYINNGGVMEFHLAVSGSGRYPNLPLPGGMQTKANPEYGDYNIIITPNHPIVSGVNDSLLYGNSASHEGFEKLPANATIITANLYGSPTLVEYNYGAGTVIATSITLEYGYFRGYSSGLILPEVFKYALSRTDTWISMQPEKGRILSNQSQEVKITYNSEELDPGIYPAHLIIQNNDPDHQVIQIPTIFTVNAKPRPHISVNADTLNAEVKSGDSMVVELSIANRGEMPLIYSIYHEEYMEPGVIQKTEMGKSTSVNPDGYLLSEIDRINHTGSDKKNIYKNLTGKREITYPVNINHNDKTKNNPAQISAPEIAGQADTSWMKIEPDSGIIQPDSSKIINVSVNALRLDPGIYTGYIVIYHNDPDTVTITIPMQVEVQVTDDINDLLAAIPKVFKLHQNYPNPFNPSTTIQYDVPKAAEITVRIYDILGREVYTIFKGKRNPGYYKTVWNGISNNGTRVASGIYFVRFVSKSFVQDKKIILIK